MDNTTGISLHPFRFNLLIIKIQRSDNELFPFGNLGHSLERKNSLILLTIGILTREGKRN